MNNSFNGVAVTGMGIISSNASNVMEFHDALLKGKHNYSLASDKCGDKPIIGAFIENYSLQNSLKKYEETMPIVVKSAVRSAMKSNLAIQAAITVCMEAWAESQMQVKKVEPERVGIVVAGSNLSQYMNYNTCLKYIEDPEYISPSYALQFMDTNVVGVLSEIFSIHGEGYTVGGASASGNVGIMHGCRMIQSGVADACVVIGTLADFSKVEFQGFQSIGALGGHSFMDSPDEACRPFDSKHEGFIYGQGSACLILESLKSAKNRGVKVLAKILGCSEVLDGNRFSDCKLEGEVRSMKLAIKNANLSICDISYINAHGTSTPLGDNTELMAIRNVYGDRANDILINSTKGLTGHCLYSAGVIEAIATILQINNGFIHPNINLNDPIEANFKFADKVAVNEVVNIAVSHAFGFGGINSAIVIGNYED